jgi:hypothetical protein
LPLIIDRAKIEFSIPDTVLQSLAVLKKERIMKRTILFAFVLLALCSAIAAAQEAAKADLPVLVASCGQSPGPMKIKVFMKRLKMDHVYSLQATAADLVDKQKAGTPFKTLIIVTGASLKGMGAAGVSIKDELARTQELIAEAKKQGIKLIAAHIEGMARRAQGAAAGDNSDELSIDAVCPQAALLLIRQDGDEDGRFTAISKESNIPMVVFQKNMELGKVLEDLFAK